MRVSTESVYRRVLLGLQSNFSKLVRAQEQVASGQRILRPSDDPTGTARVERSKKAPSWSPKCARSSSRA
jgi:flagellar hook-associated protein 3 FlgL